MKASARKRQPLIGNRSIRHLFTSERIVRTIYFVLCAEILLVILWSAPENNEPPPADTGLALLQPEAARRSAPLATGTRPRRSGKTPSLFTGEFWDAGTDPTAAPEEELEASSQPTADDDNGILEPAAKDNPRNPQTGERFTDRQMQRFDQLNRQFPGNTLVPRRRGTVRRLMETESRIVTLERAGHRDAASAEQIEQVYQFYIEREHANIRLLEYLKTFAATKEQRARHRWLQKRSHTAIQQRTNQRERFLNKLAAKLDAEENGDSPDAIE